MAIDKESNGVPEVDLGRRTTKVNLFMIVAVGLFFVLGVGLIIYFAHHTAPSGASDVGSVNGPLLIGIPILLVIPALYFLITRRTRGGRGSNRSDPTERPELTGTEQAKHRTKL